MKKYCTTAFLIILYLITTSCKDKCEGIACFTPPESFQFKVIDKNGKNISDSKIFSFSYKDAQNTKFVNLQSNTNNSGEVSLSTNFISGTQYTLLSKGTSVGELYYENVKVNENCCTYFVTTVLDFNGVSLLGKKDKDYNYVINIQ